MAKTLSFNICPPARSIDECVASISRRCLVSATLHAMLHAVKHGFYVGAVSWRSKRTLGLHPWHLTVQWPSFPPPVSLGLSQYKWKFCILQWKYSLSLDIAITFLYFQISTRLGSPQVPPGILIMPSLCSSCSLCRKWSWCVLIACLCLRFLESKLLGG